MPSENVILVDENDCPIGEMEKMKAHVEGQLHRAFSVFIFNGRNELLIHKRASHKYHSANLWTNTCCSHPRPGENSLDAAKRRLHEEMGLTCDLMHSFSFLYKASLKNGLTEHEYDHVFVGVSDDAPSPNSEEVQSWKYVRIKDIKSDIESFPEKYTEWFKICLAEHVNKLETS